MTYCPETGDEMKARDDREWSPVYYCPTCNCWWVWDGDRAAYWMRQTEPRHLEANDEYDTPHFIMGEE